MKTKKPLGERVAKSWRAIVDHLNPAPIEPQPTEGDDEDQ